MHSTVRPTLPCLSNNWKRRWATATDDKINDHFVRSTARNEDGRLPSAASTTSIGDREEVS